MKCDIDILLARAQVALAVLLIIGFFGVLLIVLLIIGLRRVELTGSTLSLVTTGLTASITMASGAAGYFFLRHRPQTAVDDDEPIPTQPHQAAQPNSQTQPGVHTP